jgi:hypothetical protein
VVRPGIDDATILGSAGGLGGVLRFREQVLSLRFNLGGL